MILGKNDSDNYFIMRDNITGRPSNIHHMLNIARKSKITKVKINESNSLEIEHINNFIFHCLGIESTSLYPSCFSSSINTKIPYSVG
jgi:hypothetical protein